jgi:ribonuclease-3
MATGYSVQAADGEDHLMLDQLQQAIGYSFKSKKLLEMAVSHVSSSAALESYERLEFLGDRILSLTIAHQLYIQFPTEEEGALAKRHSALVKQSTLLRVAEKIELASYIRVASKDTKATDSMIADVLEAIFAAIYLDSDFVSAQKVIQKLWQDLVVENILPPEEGKSALQEWAQARGLKLPDYKIVERTGPDHMPVFQVEVTLSDYPPQRGQGTSKQAAEKEAANALLHYLQEKAV